MGLSEAIPILGPSTRPMKGLARAQPILRKTIEITVLRYPEPGVPTGVVFRRRNCAL